jgi:hypothetical protein
MAILETEAVQLSNAVRDAMVALRTLVNGNQLTNNALTTTDKSNLVGAVNELKASIDALSYNDLADLPTIPSTVLELSDRTTYDFATLNTPIVNALAAKAATADLAAVATSGAYADLSGTPASVSTVAELTDATTYDFPTLNTPVSDALAAKAPKADPTFTGTVSAAAITASGTVTAPTVAGSGTTLTLDAGGATCQLRSNGRFYLPFGNAFIGSTTSSTTLNVEVNDHIYLQTSGTGIISLVSSAPVQLDNLTASGTVKGNRFEGNDTTTDAIRFSNGETRVYQNNAIVAQFQDSGLVVTNLTASGTVTASGLLSAGAGKIQITNSGLGMVSSSAGNPSWYLGVQGSSVLELSRPTSTSVQLRNHRDGDILLTSAGGSVTIGAGGNLTASGTVTAGDLVLGPTGKIYSLASQVMAVQSGGITFNPANLYQNFSVKDDNGNYALHLTGGGSNIGNFGIGVGNSPSEKLDVGGNIKASGTVTAGSVTTTTGEIYHAVINDSRINLNANRVMLHTRGLQVGYGLAVIQNGGVFGFGSSNANNSGLNTPYSGMSSAGPSLISFGNGTNGSSSATVSLTNLTASGTVQTGSYVVNTLPPTPSTGMRAQVTDSSVAAHGHFGTTVTAAGGGTEHTVPVFYDGTNWIIA